MRSDVSSSDTTVETMLPRITRDFDCWRWTLLANLIYVRTVRQLSMLVRKKLAVRMISEGKS